MSAVVDLTPRMRRVSFSSADLVGVEPAGPDQRVTLVVPEGASFGPDGLASAEYARARRYRRTYTLVDLDPVAGTAALDVVRHGAGVAGAWIERVDVGDQFVITGPMGTLRIEGAQDAYLLIADETALPALRQLVAALPATAHGEVHIEIPDDDERQDLPSAAALDVTWWPRGVASGGGAAIANGDRADGGRTEPGACLAALPGRLRTTGPHVTVWVAAEASAVATLRTHLLTDAGCDRRRVHAVAYWRRGAAGT